MKSLNPSAPIQIHFLISAGNSAKIVNTNLGAFGNALFIDSVNDSAFNEAMSFHFSVKNSPCLVSDNESLFSA
jgi:hypothetical protein